jgi:hypothetical protein
VQRAIQEAEEIKRKEEDKRAQLRLQQSKFVEISRVEKEIKERQKRQDE